MSRHRLLVDVDGPCAAMIPGYLRWVNGKFNLHVRVEDIVYHNDMGRSPALAEVDAYLRDNFYPTPEDGKVSDGGWGGAFLEFMRQPTVYSDHIEPVEGSQEALGRLGEICDIAFATALMKRANQHVPDKLDWIGRNYPGIPIMTIPSELKCWVHGTWGIDDRWDACSRWLHEGTAAMLYKLPWSEEPEWATAYGHTGWHSIVKHIESGAVPSGGRLVRPQ